MTATENTTIARRMWRLFSFVLAACVSLFVCDARAETLIHRYSFTSDASDSISGADGTLVNGASISNGAVQLDGVNGYVDLPNDLVLSLTNATIEAWVVWNGGGAFQRLYDFGNSDQGEDSSGSGSQSMFLTPNTGAGLRASVFNNGPGVQDIVDVPSLGIGGTRQVVWTFDSAIQTARIYIDGILAGSNTNATIRPADLGPTFNDWLGRSQFNDTYFNGSITEFRIYDGALSASQVTSSFTAGPDQTGRGDLESIDLRLKTAMRPGDSQQALVLADFTGLSDLDITSSSETTYQSSDPGVLTIEPSGLIKAVAPGNASITVSYQNKQEVKSVAVVAVPPGVLAHRYSFTSDASDSIGGADGILIGGASITNGEVQLDGVNGYVDLPNDLVSSLTNASIEAWVVWKGGVGFQRLYDLGNSDQGEDLSGSGSQSMFLTPNTGAGSRASIFINGPGVQDIEDGPAFATDVLTHVAWVHDALTGTSTLYINGLPVTINRSSPMSPADLGSTFNDWLGRSQFNDAYFNGSISEFRIYDGILSDAQVVANDVGGPNPETGPGSVQTVRLQLQPIMQPGSIQQAKVIADFSNVSGVNITTDSNTVYRSSNTNLITVSATGVIQAVGSENGNVTISAAYLGKEDSKTVALVLPVPAVLKNRYSFTSDASDSAGGADGVLVGGASITNGAVQLNGTDGYVNLPNDLVLSLTNATIEAWVVWNGGGAWQRLYDFGNSVQGEDLGGSGNQSMFLTPNNGGALRASVFNNGPGVQDLVDVPVLGIGSLRHIVWTFDSTIQTARIYVDGILVGANTSATIRPADLGPTFNDWLGRSQFNDTYFNGAITEFRIYDGALSVSQVASNFSAGPDVLSEDRPVLGISRSGNDLVLSWPVASSGFILESSANLGLTAQWSEATGTPVVENGLNKLTIPIGSVSAFYRLRK